MTRRGQRMKIKTPVLMSTASAIVGVIALWYLTAAPARAEEVKAGDLVISQAWSRATPGGAKIGGGYLTIENKGSAPDRLTGGSADGARPGGVAQNGPTRGGVEKRPLHKG